MSSAANAQEISLSPVQKLAALMILLGEEAAGIILKTFDKNERELVCSEMANLPMLGLEQQQSILREFTERAVAANSSLEGSEEYTKKVLERAVGMFEAEEIISRVSMSRTSVAAMQQIIDMDSLGVTNLIKEEQPQTIALVISYLPPAKASDVLLRLPESIRETVVERLAKLEPTPIEVVETVGRTLSKKIGEKITRSLNQTGGFQSAASMLKNMNRDSRDEILNNMDERIPDLVREIKSRCSPSMTWLTSTTVPAKSHDSGGRREIAAGTHCCDRPVRRRCWGPCPSGPQRVSLRRWITWARSSWLRLTRRRKPSLRLFARWRNRAIWIWDKRQWLKWRNPR